jgi:hypothetical protein
MRECPKCSSQYADDLKICRTCGAILEAAVSELPAAASASPVGAASDLSPDDDDDEALCGESASRGAWTCPQCSQPVPGNFEVCWNCSANRDGTPDSDSGEETPPPIDEAVFEQEGEPERPAAPNPPERECPKCGSTKLILGVRILDQGQYSDGSLKVAVDGNPYALIFKDRLYGRLTADICGRCGHVELKVSEASDLYEHYLQSKSAQGE